MRRLESALDRRLTILAMRRRWGLASFLSASCCFASRLRAGADGHRDAPARRRIAPRRRSATARCRAAFTRRPPRRCRRAPSRSRRCRRLRPPQRACSAPDHKFNRGDRRHRVRVRRRPTCSRSGSRSTAATTSTAGSRRRGDDGYVGDPHLLVRVAKNTGTLHVRRPARHLGARQGRAVGRGLGDLGRCARPGLAAGRARPAVVRRRASGSITARSQRRRARCGCRSQDRVSLGVSDYNAVFGGAQLRIPAGQGVGRRRGQRRHVHRFGRDASWRGRGARGPGAAGPVRCERRLQHDPSSRVRRVRRGARRFPASACGRRWPATSP